MKQELNNIPEHDYEHFADYDSERNTLDHADLVMEQIFGQVRPAWRQIEILKEERKLRDMLREVYDE